MIFYGLKVIALHSLAEPERASYTNRWMYPMFIRAELTASVQHRWPRFATNPAPSQLQTTMPGAPFHHPNPTCVTPTSLLMRTAS